MLSWVEHEKCFITWAPGQYPWDITSTAWSQYYRKVLKFSDAKIFAVIYLKFRQRGKKRIWQNEKQKRKWANSGDPDQTARRPWSDCSSRSSLIWVCTVCQELSVQKLRVIRVLCDSHLGQYDYLKSLQSSTYVHKTLPIFSFLSLYFSWKNKQTPNNNDLYEGSVLYN